MEERKNAMKTSFGLLRQIHIDVIAAIPCVDRIPTKGSFSSVQNNSINML